MPAATRLIMPLRSIRRWLTVSASAGASFSVEMKYCETRIALIFLKKRHCTASGRATRTGRTLPHYDDRQLRMRQDLLRLAAEQQRGDATAAMRRHDDRVAFRFLRGGEDHFPRSIANRMQEPAFHAAGFRLELDARQDLARLLRGELLIFFLGDRLVDDAVGIR